MYCPVFVNPERDGSLLSDKIKSFIVCPFIMKLRAVPQATGVANDVPSPEAKGVVK